MKAIAVLNLVFALVFGGIGLWWPSNWSDEDRARFMPRAFPESEVKTLEAVADLPVKGHVIRSWINYRDQTIFSLIELVNASTKFVSELAFIAAIIFFACFLGLVNAIRTSGKGQNGL